MTDIANIRALLERLRERWQQLPPTGGGNIAVGGHASHYITDDGKRLINPDGPAAATAIEAILGELDALRGGWLPIESAPKDGTEVQLFGMSPDGPRVSAGFWLEPEPPIVGDCGGECRCPEYGEPDDPFWCKMHGGNIEELKAYWMSGDGGFCAPWDATHWKPLSTPPSAGERHD